MKRRLLALFMIGVLSTSIVACGGTKASDSSNQTKNEEVNDALAIEKELFDVTMTIPAEYLGETTQEELEQKASENGYKVKLNEDGSATYTMTKRQHKEFLADYKESMNSAMQEMVGSEDYPNFTDISANDNFTEFTIKTTSTELDFNESFSVLAFYMYGAMYNSLSGENVDNIHVEFVNADSGEIISSSDSKDMEDAFGEETSEEASSVAETEVNLEDGIIDFEAENYIVTYTRHEVSTDYEGNPCLLFYYNFTNNGDDATSAMSDSYFQCFQNGIECDTAVVSADIKEIDNYYKDIKPGVTLEVCTAFELEDTSEVTIEASEWASLSDAKDVQVITLN